MATPQRETPPRETPLGATHVWFLRGINVGGAHRLPMAALRDHLADLGAANVKTYIQSGNVVFRSPAGAAAGLQQRFETEAPQRYGFPVPVVARSAAELSALVAGNPFLADLDPGADYDHTHYHLGMVRDGVDPADLSRLEPEAFQPDEYVVRDENVYFYLPAGLSGSRLVTSPGFAKLWAGMTLRNWRTVLKTLELAA